MDASLVIFLSLKLLVVLTNCACLTSMATNVYKTALSCYLVTWPISNSEARVDSFNTTFWLFVLFLCLQAFQSYHLHMESSKICNQSQFHLRFHSKARALKTHFQIEKSITLRNDVFNFFQVWSKMRLCQFRTIAIGSLLQHNNSGMYFAESCSVI